MSANTTNSNSSPHISLNTATMRIGDLAPAEYNPRTISGEALTNLSNSLTRFGLVQPIIVNIFGCTLVSTPPSTPTADHIHKYDSMPTIVGGHQRLKALLGMHGPDATTQVVLVDIPHGEEKALNLTLNNPHVQGDFQKSKTQALFEDLLAEPDLPESLTSSIGINSLLADLTGTSLDALLDEAEAINGSSEPLSTSGDSDSESGGHSSNTQDPSNETSNSHQPVGSSQSDNEHELVLNSEGSDGLAPQPEPGAQNQQLTPAEVLENAVENLPYHTKKGDIWRLGHHYLMCGSSTDKEDTDQLRAFLPPTSGKFAQIAFTSPPYLAKTMNAHKGTDKERKYAEFNDNSMSDDDYENLLKDFTLLALGFCEEVFVNVAMLAGNKRILPKYVAHYADKLKDVFTWDKTTAEPAMQYNVVNGTGELVYAFGAANTTRGFQHSQWVRGTGTNVIRVRPNSGNPYAKIHKATFPEELPKHFLINFTDPGAVVYEPFSGTGTTLVAAENTGRKCLAMELTPGYCDLTIDRWEKLTGEKAEKVVSGG